MASFQSRLFRRVARLGSWYADRALSQSLDQFRARAARGPGLPPNIRVERVIAAGVPCEWIVPGVAPGRPGVAPGRPGGLAGRRRAAAGAPGNAPRLPGSAPEVSGVMPRIQGMPGEDAGGESVASLEERGGASGRAAPRTILYLHGGGWVLGWGNTHRRMVARLGQMAGARALAPDYRLAPEHPFPAALEDCVAVYRWLLEQGTDPACIVIAGDSAGGNLTVTTMLALVAAGVPLPAAGVCISPAADLSAGQAAALRDDPMLSPRAGRMFAASYLNGQDPRHPWISPVYADLHGLPPLLIQVGGDESLRDGAERLTEAARTAGVEVTLEVWPAMWHVWHIFAPYLPEARQALQRIADFVELAAPVHA